MELCSEMDSRDENLWVRVRGEANEASFNSRMCRDHRPCFSWGTLVTLTCAEKPTVGHKQPRRLLEVVSNNTLIHQKGVTQSWADYSLTKNCYLGVE